MKPSDLTDKLPSALNEQIHVNHIGCSAGTDTKKRLYIKKVSANGYVYFCHHCDEKGIAYQSMSDKHYDRLSECKIDDIEYLAKGSMPCAFPEITHFPIISYLRGYDLNDDDVKRMRLMECGRDLVIPNTDCVMNRADMFVGQIRFFSMGGARYHTYGNKQTNYYPKGMLSGAKEPKYLAIVEDSISAYRAIRDGVWCNAISLQGSGSNDVRVNDILRILGGCTPVVWLDNDEAGKKGAMELIKKLDPLLPSKRHKCINVTGEYEEPKLLTVNDLHGII